MPSSRFFDHGQVCCFVAVATDEDSRHSHLLFTLSVYQYRVQTTTMHGHNNGLSAACLDCIPMILIIYTVNHKKRDILFLTITLANLNRF